jgi:glycosyltransferase involved in cell wall biosynthesis
VAAAARVTVAVPSLNQGRFLEQALQSIFSQGVPVEVYVADAGSTDGTVEVIRRWEGHLLGWRSAADAGQSSAINEGIAKGSAPYVCWLNSDDWWLEGALERLLGALEAHPRAAMVYGRAWHFDERTKRMRPVFVRPFGERLMAQVNLVSQPATLIRRAAWEAVGGVDETLHMAMDYDLWWRLFREHGAPVFVDAYVGVNREHGTTKTGTQRRAHYREAMDVVKRHYGRIPLKWWIAQPYAVWYRSIMGR